MQKLSYMSFASKQFLILGFHFDTGTPLKKNNASHNDLELIIKLAELLNNYKEIKATLHISGHLLTFLDSKVPNFSPNIRLLLDKNQIEFLSGGFYQPIFSITPREDRQLQILNMTRLLNHLYGYTPLGAWITELSWEGSFAQDLSKARIQYTCLPKDHFMSSGLSDKDLNGYYITEEEGRKVGIFPITHNLNSFIKNVTPNDLVNELLTNYKQNNNGNQAKTIFYNENKMDKNSFEWIKNFLDLITQNSSSFETKLLHEYYHHFKPSGRVYLAALQNINSTNTTSFWKHTLLNNHDVNLLQKKMLRVSKKINSAKEGKSRFKVIKEMINQAHDSLLKAQCNYAYWDNSEDGIYSPLDRHFVYSNLIKAENLIDAASKYGSKWIHLYEIDYDCDGNDEIIVETETQNIYISPFLGGTILEHDFRPKKINITNTISKQVVLSRNENEKHNSIKLPKLSVIDYFLEKTNNLENYKNTKLYCLTNEIIYSYLQEKIKAKEEICKIAFKSILNLEKLKECPKLEMEKQYSIKSGDSSLIIDYLITNKSSFEVGFTFGVELNYNISPTKEDLIQTLIQVNQNNNFLSVGPNSMEVIKGTNQVTLTNAQEKVDLKLSWNKTSSLITYPIMLLCNNDQNKSSVYQGTTIFPLWFITLAGSTSWDLSIKQDINLNTEEL